ncbi:MAG: septum formation initiator family protein [Candidatus Aminicenantes bacterium]|nr:septum formation initiator family protein [Candidatus Aminicenantes bacterium]
MSGKRRRGRVGWRKKLLIGFGGVVVLSLLLTAILGPKGFLGLTRAKRDYQAQVEEIRRLEQERERLKREIAELERNPRAVESEARERIWLVKPDEKVLVKKAEDR